MPARKPAAWSSAAALAVCACVIAATPFGCGSSTDNRPATFSYIWPAIIQPSCATASCHSKVAARAGVDLSDRETAYNTLTMRHFVLPGDMTGQSEILNLMAATAVRRMPPDFMLPPADIDLIASWIAQGAHDD
jgi:hypothetical protein